MPATIPPYLATVRNVSEVALRGIADAAFWQTHLTPVGLKPLIHNGQAEITISSTSARFLGWPFQEVALAITLEPDPAWESRPAIYLIQAFNSSRLLGWIERQFFSTPYFHAQASNQIAPTPGFRVQTEGVLLCLTEMQPELPQPLRQGYECWSGVIYLPPTAPTHRGSSVFFAEFSGETTTYPFQTERDTCQFIAHERWPAWGWLPASHFQGQEWSVRSNAVHTRSKTIRSNSTRV